MSANTFIAIKSQITGAGPITIDATQYSSITVSADNLAGTEKVTLKILAGSTGKQVTDIYGTTVNLTATISVVTLTGGVMYTVTKDATVAACAVYYNPNLRS